MAIKNKLATQDFAKEVLYAPATLTPEQKAQAQKNIGMPEITAADAGLVLGVSEQGTWELSLAGGGGGGEGVAVQSDWNVTDENDPAYIKNKPFGETVEIIERIDWDGNTEGLTSVAGVFYKVSDSIFTDEQIKTCTILASDGFSLVASQIWDDAVSMGVVTEDSVMLEVAIFIRRPTVLFDVAFNEPGVYFGNDSGVYVTSVTFSEPIKLATLKKIEPKYLYQPDWNQTDDTQADFIKNKPVSLPTVTTTDAGKFLRVTDEGIWAAVSIPNAEGVGF